ncbi:MAG: TldD/PmbA family protein [Candidatus Woesearchaeota archaeon]
MIDKIVNYLKSKSSQYEVFYTCNTSTDAEVTKDRISFVSDGVTHGIAIRLIIDNRSGFAYTSNLENYRHCVDTAIKVAKSSRPDRDFRGFVSPKRFRKVDSFNKELASAGPDWMHRFSNDYVDRIKSIDSSITCSSALLSKDIEEMRIINSEGLDVEDKIAAVAFQGSLLMKHDGKLGSVDFEHGDKKFLDPEVAQDSALRLIGQIGKQNVKTSDMQLIFHPDAMAALLGESYAFSVDGSNNYLKKSLWRGKLGQKVMDGKISIVDDAITPGLFCTRPFDSEGSPSRNIKVIDKGVLKNFLYDSYYSKLAERESTGNAYRNAVTLPKISPNNIIIEPGKVKDIISEADKALYVRGMLGLHTMNEATGDFSLGVIEGHYVENGQIRYPVKDVMIAGNFFELMNGISAIGKEVKHSLEVSGGCYLPEMMFDRIKVIGK